MTRSHPWTGTVYFVGCPEHGYDHHATTREAADGWTCPKCAPELEWEGPTDAEIYQAVHVYNKEN